MASIEEVLDGEDEDYGDESESEGDEYQMYVDELGGALGLSPEAAKKAASAICALARYEMEAGSEPAPEPSSKGKSKPGIAAILGGE